MMKTFFVRLDVLEDMCLAVFVATYTTGGKDAPNDAGEHICDILEWSDDNKAGGNDSDAEETPTKLPTIITLRNSLRYMKKC